jgi:hypothetical protein
MNGNQLLLERQGPCGSELQVQYEVRWNNTRKSDDSGLIFSGPQQFRVLEAGSCGSGEQSESVGYAIAYDCAEGVPLFESAVAVETLQSGGVFSNSHDFDASGICAAAVELGLQQSHIDRVSTGQSIEGD